jgi:imidazolonepropionase-like amidohydrolase
MQTFIKGGLIVQATGQESIRNGVVAIDEGRIVAVGQAVDFPESPAHAELIDAEGCTVLPGLIDCHVHVFAYPHIAGFSESEATVWATNYLQFALRSGVTTIRDLASPWDAIFSLRRGVEDGWIVGPRMRVAGKAITMTGGHGHSDGTVEADGPIEVMRAARQQLKKGADLIKLMASGGVATAGELPTSWQLEVEEMRAAVNEAHKRGKPTSAHAHATTGIKNALLAGIDCIEHGVYLDDETIELMVKNDTALSPTLSVYARIIQGANAGLVPAYRAEKAVKLIDTHAESFRKALAAGVKITLGTDAVSIHHPLGDVALELELWVKNGMKPGDAIEAATRVAAAVCQVDQEVGTLQAGKQADILIVEGDGLADISTINNVRYVLRNGVTVYSALAGGATVGLVSPPVVQNLWRAEARGGVPRPDT